jgi:hypothetical protein
MPPVYQFNHQLTSFPREDLTAKLVMDTQKPDRWLPLDCTAREEYIRDPIVEQVKDT